MDCVTIIITVGLILILDIYIVMNMIKHLYLTNKIHKDIGLNSLYKQTGEINE